MLTIAWDIDDCLNDLMNLWFQQEWLPGHTSLRMKFDEIVENPPHRLLGVSIEEYLGSLDNFRLSNKYKEMKPVPEVKKWFLKHGKHFRHVAITAVPLHAANISAEWTLRHFGVWIRTFHFVPSIRKGLKIPQYDKSKNDFLSKFKRIDFLIDDNQTNLRQSKESGIKSILFPRPWNKSNLSISETLRMFERL